MDGEYCELGYIWEWGMGNGDEMEMRRRTPDNHNKIAVRACF